MEEVRERSFSAPFLEMTRAPVEIAGESKRKIVTPLIFFSEVRVVMKLESRFPTSSKCRTSKESSFFSKLRRNCFNFSPKTASSSSTNPNFSSPLDIISQAFLCDKKQPTSPGESFL